MAKVTLFDFWSWTRRSHTASAFSLEMLTFRIQTRGRMTSPWRGSSGEKRRHPEFPVPAQLPTDRRHQLTSCASEQSWGWSLQPSQAASPAAATWSRDQSSPPTLPKSQICDLNRWLLFFQATKFWSGLPCSKSNWNSMQMVAKAFQREQF